MCDEAKLSKVDRNFLWRRQFLNPYAFLEAPEVVTKLID
jgi:serine/threonine-protein kinase HipA